MDLHESVIDLLKLFVIFLLVAVQGLPNPIDLLDDGIRLFLHILQHNL
jgi:hypothetical protein